MDTPDTRPGQISNYLKYLPAVLQQDDDSGATFLGRFLLAFEHVLNGLGDAAPRGIAETIAGLYRFFDPLTDLTADFGGDSERENERLEWLAGWVSLSLRADLTDVQRRDFIARAASLYPLRGTRQGLEQFIAIYSRLGATINELTSAMQLGVHSQIGVDTQLDGGAPFCFRITVRLAETDPAKIAGHRQIITAILDMEKPAHTYYILSESDLQTPTLQIGIYSHVGVDTLLSPRPS
jgi:phage tail-like protein